MTLGDRIVVMSKGHYPGQVGPAGSTRSTATRVNRFVAAFIGSPP